MANVVMNERNQLLLVKPEDTYGTYANPDGASAITMKSINVEAVHDKEQLNILKGMLGAQGAITVKEYTKVSGEVYLVGSGVAGTPPAWAPFMKASANAEVVTPGVDVQYTPVDSALGSLSIAWRNGTLEHRIVGVRGAVSRMYEVGKAPSLTFNGEGLYLAPTVGNAEPAGVNTTMMTPVSVNKNTVSTMSFYGQAVQMQSVKITDGNAFGYTELVGFEEVEQSDRKGSVEVKFRCTEDEFVLFLEKSQNSEYGALELEFGVNAGEIFNENLPKIQMSSVPKLSWDGGKSYLSVTCDIVPAAKNTDYTLTLM